MVIAITLRVMTISWDSDNKLHPPAKLTMATANGKQYHKKSYRLLVIVLQAVCNAFTDAL